MSGLLKQTEHEVIRPLPEAWLLSSAVPEETAVRAVTLREELLPLFDGQSEHPVLFKIDAEDLRREFRSRGLVEGLAWAVEMIKEREKSIRLMEHDPFRHGYEPPMWRKILIWMCRKRLEMPVAVLVFYVLGGIRSGKTDLGGKRTAQHTAVYHRLTKVGQYQAWSWAVHQNETRSKDIGQKRVYEYLPIEWRTAKIGKKQGGRMNYMDGAGFTGNQFSYQNRLCQFMFSGMDPTVLQGPELSFAWLDEEQPAALCGTVRERLTTHAAQAGHGKHLALVRECLHRLEHGGDLTAQEVASIHLGVLLHTFTPKDGWTKVVADALNGAEVVEEEDAPALPHYGEPGPGGTRELLGYLKAPRVKQCKDKASMIFYIWTEDNKWGGYESVLQTCEGKSEADKRILLYGDVQKDWRTAYPGYRDESYRTGGHLIDLHEIPRDVTVRKYVDAAESRPMFTVWIGTDRVGRDYILNEWPREGDYIPGHGDPGAWAEPSSSERKDGDQGPAQKTLLRFGFRDYMAEWERVERQIGAWKAGVEDPFVLSAEELSKHERIAVWEEQMDSRLGHAPTMNEGGQSTLMDDFNKLGCGFVPAAGDRLKEGDNKMNDALAAQKDGLFHGPRLLVGSHCRATRFMLANYTGEDKAKGACKDPRDAVVFHLTNEDRGYVEKMKPLDGEGCGW